MLKPQCHASIDQSAITVWIGKSQDWIVGGKEPWLDAEINQHKQVVVACGGFRDTVSLKALAHIETLMQAEARRLLTE